MPATIPSRMSVAGGNTPDTQNTAAGTTPAVVTTGPVTATIHLRNKGPEHLSASRIAGRAFQPLTEAVPVSRCPVKRCDQPVSELTVTVKSYQPLL